MIHLPLARHQMSQVKILIKEQASANLRLMREIVRGQLRDHFYDLAGCSESLASQDDQPSLQLAVVKFATHGLDDVEGVVDVGPKEVRMEWNQYNLSEHEWTWPPSLHDTVFDAVKKKVRFTPFPL